MKKGFTLIELVVVIVVLWAVGSLGYNKIKQRWTNTSPQSAKTYRINTTNSDRDYANNLMREHLKMFHGGN